CEAQHQLHSARPPLLWSTQYRHSGFERAKEQRLGAHAAVRKRRRALPRREPQAVTRWLTSALRSRSTQQESLRACRQAELCWRRARRASGPTLKSGAFALQTDG